MQTAFLWQDLAALLPALQGTLAGGGPPRMSDVVGLRQAVLRLQTPSVQNTDRKNGDGSSCRATTVAPRVNLSKA